MSTVTFDILARDRASATFRHIGNETSTLNTRLEGLRATARRLVTAFGAFEVGRELTNFASGSVKAYTEVQQSQARLTDAYRRFPALLDVQIGAFRRLNQALQDKTGADRGQLAAAEASLAQFNLTGRAIKQLTPLINDYAQKTGQDVVTAATGVGRALLGNTRALKSVGIEFKATGNQAKDAAALTQLLRDKLGGFAAHEAKTAQGQARIMSESFKQAREEIGKALLPVLLKVGHTLTDTVIPAVRGLANFIDQHIRPTLDKWAEAVKSNLAPALHALGGFIRNDVAPALRIFGQFLTQHVLPGVEAFAKALLGGLRSALHTIEGAFKKNAGGLKVFAEIIGGLATFIVSKVVPILGTVLGKALEIAARNFALTIRIVGLLGDALKSIAHFFTGTFVRAVGTMVSYVVKGFKYVADIWLSVVGSIIHGAADAFGWIPGLGGKLKGAASAFDSFRASVDSTLSSIASDATNWGLNTGQNFAGGVFKGYAAAANYYAKNNPSLKGLAKSLGQDKSSAPPTQFSYDPTGLNIGKQTGNSVAAGLKSTQSNVVSAAKSMVDKINQQFQSLKDSAKQLAQSIADTMRSSAALTNIFQTPSTVAQAFAPTIGNVKAFLRAMLNRDLTFKHDLEKARSKGLSQALYEQLAQAGPDQAGSIVRTLSLGSRSDIATIDRLNRQIGATSSRLGSEVSASHYGSRLAVLQAESHRANHLLAELNKTAAEIKQAKATVDQLRKINQKIDGLAQEVRGAQHKSASRTS